MTAPAITLETPEQKAARLAAAQAAQKLQSPALGLASAPIAPSSAPGAKAPTDMMTKTISGKPPQDRIALAQKAWDTRVAQGAPAYEASLRSATSQAAGAGQLGSGMLRTTLGDLALNRQRDMDQQYQTLMNDAITGSIQDNQFDVGVQQQQQQFQSGEDARRFGQALASQQLGLDTSLGLGELGIKQQQATTNRMDTTGSQELQRAELVAKYGASDADRMLEQQRITNQSQQFGLGLADTQAARALQNQQFLQSQGQQANQFGQSLQEQIATRLQQGGINRDELNLKAQQLQQEAALQGRSMSIQEAQNAAQNALESTRIGNQASQFQQGFGLDQQKMALDQMVQSGQLSLAQRNQALNELQNQQQYGLSQANLGLEQQRLAQQGQQFQQGQDLQRMLGLGDLDIRRQQLAQGGNEFQQSLALQQRAQDIDAAYRNGQLTLAQREQALRELSNTQQFGLDQQRITNQNTQFGQSLQEQIANRLQQNAQFGAEQGQQLSQFNTAQANAMAQSQQSLMAQLAQILGNKDYSAMAGGGDIANYLMGVLRAGGAAQAGAGGVSRSPATGGVPWSPTTPIGGGTPPAAGVPAAAPIPTMLVSEDVTTSGPWVPPTASGTSAPLIPTAAGGTMTPQGTPQNPFAGYQTDQGGTFGGYASAILPDIKQKYGKDMTFKQFDQAFVTNANAMKQVPPLSREEVAMMSQYDLGANNVKEKIAMGLPISDKELAFVRSVRGAELGQATDSPTFGSFGIAPGSYTPAPQAGEPLPVPIPLAQPQSSMEDTGAVPPGDETMMRLRRIFGSGV